MTRKSTTHSGGKTTAAQQRINQVLSLAALSRLLQVNFADGANLIVLDYNPGGYVPTGVYAEQDIKKWVRLFRKHLGSKFQYVRFTGYGYGAQSATVHYVAVSMQLEAAEHLAGTWEYGPARIEKIGCGQLVTLVAQLLANARIKPGQHTWAASRGLRRS